MIVLCPERFEAIREFAKSINDTTFEACLKRLQGWEESSQKTERPTTLYIGSDFAPHSLSFSLRYADGRIDINGGLLFHGDPDQSMAVCIDGPFVGWRTHT